MKTEIVAVTLCLVLGLVASLQLVSYAWIIADALEVAAILIAVAAARSKAANTDQKVVFYVLVGLAGAVFLGSSF